MFGLNSLVEWNGWVGGSGRLLLNRLYVYLYLQTYYVRSSGGQGRGCWKRTLPRSRHSSGSWFIYFFGYMCVIVGVMDQNQCAYICIHIDRIYMCVCPGGRWPEHPSVPLSDLSPVTHKHTNTAKHTHLRRRVQQHGAACLGHQHVEGGGVEVRCRFWV